MKKVVLIALIIMICTVALWAQQGAAFADKPAVLTSLGQSADLEMVRVLLNRGGITFRADAVIQAGDLTSNDKTLILVIGGSSKGLGAAGVSQADEMRRTQALLQRAKDLNMSIIALHIGGAARRGPLSDELIKYAVPLANYTIIVTDSNQDGLFTSLTNAARIPLSIVERISAVGTPLTAAFR